MNVEFVNVGTPGVGSLTLEAETQAERKSLYALSNELQDAGVRNTHTKDLVNREVSKIQLIVKSTLR